MWATVVLDGLTFGTFSSLMHVFSIFILAALAMVSDFVFSTVSATMTLVSNLFTTLVLEPANTAINAVQPLWNTCELAISRFFSQVVGSFFIPAASFPTLLFGSLSSLSDCTDGTTNGNSSAKVYISTLTQNTTHLLNLALPFESTFPLVIMISFFWLSRPIGDTDKIWADSIADAFARKCTISRSHSTTRLVRLAYAVAASTGIYDQIKSAANHLSLTIMALAIWFLRPVTKKRTAEQTDDLETIQQLVTRIQDDKEANKRLMQNHKGLLQAYTELQGQINKLNDDLRRTNQSGKTKDDTIRSLNDRLAGLGQTINQLKDQIRNANQKRQKEIQTHTTRLNNALREANKMSATLIPKVTSLERDLESTQQRYIEAQFENELLKCAPAKPDSVAPPATSDFAVPFVLVLVDGDAYGWSASHFVQTQHPPGANAAQAIKAQVQKYLVDNKTHIPVQSRIIVRVFQNIQDTTSAVIKGYHSTRRLTNEFLKDFTQSMPLFDYIDCGRGKERADSKIQELAHLFILNPSCHTIFLAAATDNGFARMLEQYAYDDAARKKIVLVHPGYVIREISVLGFQAVQWSSVFQPQHMPKRSRDMAARVAAVAVDWKGERDYATVTLLFEKASGLGKFRDLSRGSSTGMFRKIEGDISRVTVEASTGGDGQLLELD